MEPILPPDLQEVLTGAAAKAQPGVLEKFVDLSQRVQDKPDSVDTNELVEGINTGIRMMTQDIPSFNLSLPDPSKMGFLQRRGLRLNRAMDPMYDQKLQAKNFQFKMQAMAQVGQAMSSMMAQLKALNRDPFTDAQISAYQSALTQHYTMELKRMAVEGDLEEVIRSEGLNEQQGAALRANAYRKLLELPTSQEERSSRMDAVKAGLENSKNVATLLEKGFAVEDIARIAPELADAARNAAPNVAAAKAQEERWKNIDDRNVAFGEVKALAQNIFESRIQYVMIEEGDSFRASKWARIVPEGWTMDQAWDEAMAKFNEHNPLFQDDLNMDDLRERLEATGHPAE